MGCGTSMGRTGTLIIIGGIGGMGGRGGMVCCGMGGGGAAAGIGGGATTTVFTIGSIGSGMRPFCLWIWAIWSLRLQQECQCINRRRWRLLVLGQNLFLRAVLRIRIRDPVPFDPRIRDSESGVGFFWIPDPKPIFLGA